uniref:Secreted protein n=1 Tax=Triticum urartu TaxID=4572 RepID=A0A8R7K2N2_TRIUA
MHGDSAAVSYLLLLISSRPSFCCGVSSPVPPFFTQRVVDPNSFRLFVVVPRCPILLQMEQHLVDVDATTPGLM